jgi:aldehyde:ferredoxin oxidoreductase
MLPGDSLANVLTVDLSRRSFQLERREDLFEAGLGGAGVAIRLLSESVPAGADPLGPDNVVVFAVGPLTGYFPMASKTVAMFKSPHTGNLGESHAGGRSAIAIRLAGLGAIVIRGSSASPVYLVVEGEQVHFRDASALWGMSSAFTAGRVIRERERGAGLRTIMRIGRAGERMISYATVNTETYRHFGRLGLGAVFGAKKLKGLMVYGSSRLPPPGWKGYRELYGRIFQEATQSPLMRKYHDLGTAENVLPLNALGALPVRNLQAGSMEGAEAISGEGLAAHYLGRRLACAHCPVACIHIAALRTPYQEEPYFYKTQMISYDHEPIFSLASLLGIGDPAVFLHLMDRVETLGMDCMTTGVVLAWATEAMERGLIKPEQAGGLRLAWGDGETYGRAVEKIVEGEGELFASLGQGLARTVARFGGEEFALTFAGNEMAGYHTGPGTHLGFTIGARHSHLDNAGYSFDQKAQPGNLLPPEKLAEGLIAEERWRQVLASLAVCFFARGIYDRETVAQALELVGLPRDGGQLEAFGRQVHAAKYAFKLREGFRFQDLRFPQRIFQTPTFLGPISPEYMAQGLAAARSLIEAELTAPGPSD